MTEEQILELLISKTESMTDEQKSELAGVMIMLKEEGMTDISKIIEKAVKIVSED